MKLLEPITLGGIPLKNRMVMAPMTRSRADHEGIVNDLIKQYYVQRASAGLIISEGINISPQAKGNPFTAGLFTQEQINAWREVTNAIHDNGGVIYAQLGHTGRIGHSVDKAGELPVAPSAIAAEGQHFTTQGLKEFERPRELTIPEIKGIIQDFGQAARNAMEAGFDGVELHASNGYLANQFLADSANFRSDEYGGNIENRNRFVLEVMQTLVDAVGPDKVGIKIAPTNPANSIVFDNPVKQFDHLILALNRMPLSYIHLMHNDPAFPHIPHYPKDVIETFGTKITHTLIANTAYTKETSEKELQKGVVNMISYAALFLANPDLPKRFEKGAALNEPVSETYYGGAEKGFIDYPFMD